MIKYKYITRWQENIVPFESMHINDGTLPSFRSLQLMASSNPYCHETLIQFTSTIIQFIMNHFDSDKTLTGLFRLIKFTNKHRICPFLATHDYCIKILNIEANGSVAMNISPIYQLGPDYPEHYERHQGKVLNKDAIIGLLNSDQINPEEPTTFNLGIDAGIAFSQAKISHNKRMTLNINLIDEGIIATLQCEGQTTSRVFNWDDLGMPSAAYADLYSQKIHDIWAA